MVQSSDTSKESGTHRGCPEFAPHCDVYTHVPIAHPTTKARQDSQGHYACRVVKDSQSLPIKPGGNFSLNTIYSKHCVHKRQGLIILWGRGSCQGSGSWASGLRPPHIIREKEREKEVCLQVTQNNLQVSTWILQMWIKIRIKDYTSL